MDALDAATRTTDAVSYLPAGFMLDAATYAHGAEIGFDGIDFYFAGRGGALGEVPGSVVAATFVFFEPQHAAQAFERGCKVRPPSEAADEFAGCLARWSEEHLPGDVDYARLAELLGRVIAGSSPAAAPLFAAWAARPEPDAAPAKALHRLNVIRELRGGLHGAAVIAQGLAPLEALSVKTPFMAALFGWGEPLADTSAFADAHSRAEAATNRAIATGFDSLEPSERDELVELLATAHSGVK
ncbi:MAG: SCO6745 family protein [Acidimicrobiales bacterium]